MRRGWGANWPTLLPAYQPVSQYKVVVANLLSACLFFYLTNICYILYVTKFVVKTTGTLSFSFKMYLPFESIFFPIQKPWGSHVAYQLMTFCSLNILLYNHSQFLYFFLQEVACHNVHLKQSNSIVGGCIITSCLLDICVLRPFLHTLRLQCQF